MKPHIKNVFFGAAVLVAFAAYLVSYATTVRQPVEWKDGDLVVQDSKIEPILPVFAAEGSSATHIGIVAQTESGTVVIEAAETVVETPINEFIKRGKLKDYSVYRDPNLTQEQGAKIVASARSHLGKPNDFFLSSNQDQLYSSELARLAFASVGLQLGRTQRLASVAKELAPVSSKFMGNWSNNAACKRRYLSWEQCWDVVARQDIITPSSIISDQRVVRIFDTATPPAGDTDQPSRPNS